MEIKGKLLQKTGENAGVSKAGNSYRIATYLLQTFGTYAKNVAFEVFDGQSGRIAQFDSMIGKEVTVRYDLESSPGKEGRWFTSVRAYSVQAIVRNASAAPATQTPEQGTMGDDRGDNFPWP